MEVIRRSSGWQTPEELQVTAARSRRVGDEVMPSDIRWVRSSFVPEVDGSLGHFCTYQASSAERIRERAGIPATLVHPVADTVIVRPDPVAAVATRPRGAVAETQGCLDHDRFMVEAPAVHETPKPERMTRCWS